MNPGRSLCVALPVIVASAAAPAAAEVYFDEAQALAVLFGQNATVRREQKMLDEATRAKLGRSSNLEFPESSYTLFIHDQAGQAGGYAVVMNEIGKSEPITFMVGMTPEGKVTDVVVMVFRENRGWEVKEKRFLNQFHGKSAKNSIRVNEDIINYTGATLSSKALARGVKRALLLLDTFYPRELRGQLPLKGRLVRPFSSQPMVVDASGSLALFRQRRFRVGTVCEIRAWSRSALDAQCGFDAGFAELQRIEQVFSVYRYDSELSKANREAASGPIEVSKELFDLTAYAVRAWKASRGSFDITVGPLIAAWGFRDENPRIPSKTEFRAARRLVGSDKLILRRKQRTLQFQRTGMSLDFGGLAKGYAAQRVAQTVQRHGAIAALVNLGGSSLAASAGHSLARQDWIVGIADPTDTARYARFLYLQAGECLSTSGTYEQQIEVDGVRVSHLLDPRTGQPLQGLRSATAIALSGRRSEVASKVLLMRSRIEQAGNALTDIAGPA